MRERYNKLAEYANQLNFELENARKQLNERSLLGRDSVKSCFSFNGKYSMNFSLNRVFLEMNRLKLKMNVDVQLNLKMNYLP